MIDIVFRRVSVLNLFAFDVGLSFCLLLVLQHRLLSHLPVSCSGFVVTCQILLNRWIMGRTCVEGSPCQMHDVTTRYDHSQCNVNSRTTIGQAS